MKQLYKIIFIITFFLNTICIYFISNDYDILGLIDYEDLLSIYNIFIFLVLSLFTKKLKNINNYFKNWIYIFLIMCLLSSIQSYLLFDQNIIDGIIAQKEIISMSLLYFPFSKIFNNVISKEELINIIKKFAILQLILFISQYFLSSKISFLSVYTAERYGEIRYYYNPILIDLFLIINLNEFINNNKKNIKFKSILWIIVVLFEIMVVQKYRLTTLALIIIIIMGLLFGKTKTINKMTHVFTAGLFSLIMVNTRIVQDFILEFTVKTKSYTFSIREAGRKLYLNTVSKHLLLGGGYPKNELALLNAGAYDKIYFSDNGIFGFMYIYGGIGLLWYITLWFKMIKNGFEIFKKNSNIIYLIFPLFFIITCVNELHWYWHHGLFIFKIFIILLQNEITEIKQ